MINRRRFLHQAGGCVALSLSSSALAVKVPYRAMNHVERVDAALEGKPVDRPPYTIFKTMEHSTPEQEASAYLRFHNSFNTDIVTVMNPLSYPTSGARGWFDTKVIDSPFSDHLQTLQMIRKGLKGRAYFADTICSPFTTAWHLFSKQKQYEKAGRAVGADSDLISEFRDFQNSRTDAWADALEAITQSTMNHILRLKECGVSGVFVKLINLSSAFGTPDEYGQFSQPYDDRIVRELSWTKLAILQLEQLDRAFLSQRLVQEAPVIHYSTFRSGIPIAELRTCYSGTIMGGVDEIHYTALSEKKIRTQWASAWAEAGPRFIVAPGGPLPAGATGRQLGHLQDSLGAW